jgi:hypothetical protein
VSQKSPKRRRQSSAPTARAETSGPARVDAPATRKSADPAAGTGGTNAAAVTDVAAGKGDSGTDAGTDTDARTETGAGPDAGAGRASLRLTAAATVAGLEGLAVVVWGITTCFSGGTDAVLGGLLVLVMAALPLGAAYGLLRARRWSRGPALIMQLISLPIAWTMLRGDGGYVAAGAVLGVLALAGLALLVHPATTDALGINRTAS